MTSHGFCRKCSSAMMDRVAWRNEVSRTVSRTVSRKSTGAAVTLTTPTVASNKDNQTTVMEGAKWRGRCMRLAAVGAHARRRSGTQLPASSKYYVLRSEAKEVPFTEDGSLADHGAPVNARRLRCLRYYVQQTALSIARRDFAIRDHVADCPAYGPLTWRCRPSVR